MKMFGIGEIVVDVKTGETGRVFDSDVGCEGVMVVVNSNLCLWLYKNIDKYVAAA
jgi:hypothetical protein